jgi:hypothetical protein
MSGIATDRAAGTVGLVMVGLPADAAANMRARTVIRRMTEFLAVFALERFGTLSLVMSFLQAVFGTAS